MNNVLFGLWFFLPAGLANVAPIFASRIPFLSHLSYPLDCNQTLGGTRVLGNHKTVRGMIAGITVGVVTAWVQRAFFMQQGWFVPSSYYHVNPFILGGLLGLGALGGDALKSFFKRQQGVSEGKSWLVFDQVDYIVGGIITSFWYYPLSLQMYLIILVEWVGLHLISSYIGYLLRLKQAPI